MAARAALLLGWGREVLGGKKERRKGMSFFIPFFFLLFSSSLSLLQLPLFSSSSLLFSHTYRQNSANRAWLSA